MSALFDQIASFEQLFKAWQNVKAKGSSGGVDQVSIEMFDGNSNEYLEGLRKQLIEETYIPEPYKSFNIPKDGNEFRKLGLPTVKDKIVQTATRYSIEPLFEEQFLNVSYAYRPEKGAVKAIRRVQHRLLGEHLEWVTIADIDNFFDTIQPEILFTLLNETINCPEVMRIIRLWVQIGSLNFRLKYQPYSEGIPQGAILSPLFSNIYLHPFDRFMTDKGHALVRYADDFIILSKTREAALQAFNDTQTFLENHLKLRLNKEWKVKKAINGFEFLHINFFDGKISVTKERFQHLCEKIDNSLKFSNELPDIDHANKKLRGILNFYGQLLDGNTINQLDDYLQQALLRFLTDGLQSGKIKNLNQVENFLKPIIFLSVKTEGNRNVTIKQLIEQIKNARRVRDAINKSGNIQKSVEKAIEKKKKQYEHIADAGRELVVSQPGIFIGKSKKGITLHEKGKLKATASIHNLSHISIMSHGISISENTIRYCAENMIPIDFIAFNGLPYAKIFAPVYPDAAIGTAQMKALDNGVGISLIRQMITGKMKNQLSLLKYYYKYRKETKDDYNDSYEKCCTIIENEIARIKTLNDTKLDTFRASLMGHEGVAAASYWEMIVRLLNAYIVFEGRERQGAVDPVNSMLNYGYGILYSRVWEAIIRERLNPHISFLHVCSQNQPTLAFDLIEEFRQQVVDKIVFSLITKNGPIEMEQGQLKQQTRKRLVEKLLERLNSKENFRGHKLRITEIIQHQARAMALHVQGIKTYKPYVGKW